eukprot:364416-Chlamydomonas_euryale.AAC.25
MSTCHPIGSIVAMMACTQASTHDAAECKHLSSAEHIILGMRSQALETDSRTHAVHCNSHAEAVPPDFSVEVNTCDRSSRGAHTTVKHLHTFTSGLAGTA